MTSRYVRSRNIAYSTRFRRHIARIDISRKDELPVGQRLLQEDFDLFVLFLLGCHVCGEIVSAEARSDNTFSAC
jgi:hypothetical protein